MRQKHLCNLPARVQTIIARLIDAYAGPVPKLHLDDPFSRMIECTLEASCSNADHGISNWEGGYPDVLQSWHRVHWHGGEATVGVLRGEPHQPSPCGKRYQFSFANCGFLFGPKLQRIQSSLPGYPQQDGVHDPFLKSFLGMLIPPQWPALNIGWLQRPNVLCRGGFHK